ncbi:MAG: cation transporter, partial [Oscillospiraceae bacterium]|nr:cation transporter [Oscillospiraceae bacterium]
MEKIILNVKGMSCEHCVAAVKNAASAVPSVTGVDVSLKAGTVTLDYDPALTSVKRIRDAIEDEGY